jgi:transcriptional regulator with XRE-family HTH domain
MSHLPFPDNLKTARILKELTQEELADKINISREAYSGYEQGRRRPCYETLILICEVLEVLDLQRFLTKPNYFESKMVRIAPNEINNSL